MNRKAFVGDLVTVLVVLFVLVIVVVSMAFIFGEINDRFQANDGISSEGKNITGTLEAGYVGLWDGIAVMVFALLSIALLISVASLGTRPEFFFLIIIVALFLIGVAAIFANVYDTFTSQGFSTLITEFTYIPLIMNNLVEIALFLVALLIIGAFVKLQGVV